jgi:hypothetical protein
VGISERAAAPIQTIAQFRHAFPANVDAGTLQKLGFAPNNESYIINLSMYAAAYAIGIFFWLKIDATKPIIPDEPSEAVTPAAEPR